VIDRGAAPHGLPAAVEAAVRAGVDWVQLRERALDGAPLLAFADEIAAAARRGARAVEREVRILVNRRADVALAIGADGVHLGFDAVDVAAARRVLGEGALVGVSTHSPGEVRTAAAAGGASYVQLAPIFAPLSKPASRPSLGVGALEAAAREAVPVIAQGGIDASNAAAVAAAGAAGAAVTGALLLSDDIAAATASLRAALRSGSREVRRRPPE
jgi:thiamine-phosphate diphosphorylase